MNPLNSATENAIRCTSGYVTSTWKLPFFTLAETESYVEAPYIARLLQEAGDVELNPGPLTRQMKISATGDLIDEEDGDTGEETSESVLPILKAIRADIKGLRNDMRQVNKTVRDIQMKQDDLVEQNKKLTERIDELEREAVALRSQTCRNNLIFRGVKESEDETWDDCERTVRETLKSKLDMKDAEDATLVSIERAHRLNVKMKQGVPRPIIVKFLSYKTRTEILQKARDTLTRDSGLSVSEDFPPQVRRSRKKLIPFLVKARNEGKRSYLSYDKLVVDGKKYKINANTNELISF